MYRIKASFGEFEVLKVTELSLWAIPNGGAPGPAVFMPVQIARRLPDGGDSLSKWSRWRPADPEDLVIGESSGREWRLTAARPIEYQLVPGADGVEFEVITIAFKSFEPSVSGLRHG